jgi:type VII secretion integral membrane protein EccD
VTGLVKITVDALGCRTDLALPADTPLAELLPDVLRHAGEGHAESLADRGEAHGGWVLRRSDGVPLSAGETLAAGRVRDGDLLFLVAAREQWPEPEYDDVVDAIADVARRTGRTWDGAATRLAGLAFAAVALLLGAVVLARTGPAAGPIAFGVAALLVAVGAWVARGYGDAVTGSVLAALALPFAFVGGLVMADLLAGAVATMVAALLGAVGAGYPRMVFVAGTTAAALGALGAFAGRDLAVPAAGAVVLTLVVTGAAALPMLALRLGRLPVAGRPGDREALRAAVARTDELLGGMLLGSAGAASGAAALVAGGGVAGRVLVGLAAAGFAVRARLFPAVRHRLPLLIAGTAGVVVLVVGARAGLPLGIALVAVGGVAVLAGSRYRAPGPYLARAADLLDGLCVVATIPVACAVLGLYGRIRGLIS